jgi:hypothetical protein
MLHQTRNRFDAVIEDYRSPSEVLWLKRLAYYFPICVLSWFLIPLSSVVIATIPRRSIGIQNPGEDAAAFRRFAQFLNDLRPGRIRRGFGPLDSSGASGAQDVNLLIGNDFCVTS